MARRRKQTVDACAVLNQLGIKRANFHALPSHKVVALLEIAEYRKPKSANGSRGRYFFAKLQRECR